MGNQITEEAIRLATEHVRKANSATATGIGRALGIGYTDSRSVLSELEKRGFVRKLSTTSRDYVVAPVDGEEAKTVKIGLFDVYLTLDGWVVQEGSRIVKNRLSTYEAAVNIAEFWTEHDKKEGKSRR